MLVFISIAILMQVLFGCQKLERQKSSQQLWVEDQKFVDSFGRQVILHGINVVNKNPAKKYLGDEGPADSVAMRQWGFNCIRLGIIWDGLEPEPGFYDEDYLKGVDERIAWAFGTFGLRPKAAQGFTAFICGRGKKCPVIKWRTGYAISSCIFSNIHFFNSVLDELWPRTDH